MIDIGKARIQAERFVTLVESMLGRAVARG
jgi:hypothetical protein